MKAQCATTRVRNTAKWILMNIQSERRRIDESVIADRIAHYQKPRWYRKAKTLTREEAIESLKRDGDWFGWRSYYASHKVCRLETIIHTCDMILGKYGVGEAIVLEEEDLKVFEWWTEVEQGKFKDYFNE